MQLLRLIINSVSKRIKYIRIWINKLSFSWEGIWLINHMKRCNLQRTLKLLSTNLYLKPSNLYLTRFCAFFVQIKFKKSQYITFRNFPLYWCPATQNCFIDAFYWRLNLLKPIQQNKKKKLGPHLGWYQPVLALQCISNL